MKVKQAKKNSFIKTPGKLSKRIQWLRDYYFKGAKRSWNNEFTVWSTGTDWDLQYQELTYYIVPEVYLLFDAMIGGYKQGARNIKLKNDFWELSLVERKAWFLKEVMTKHVPQELLPGDLLAGAKFNLVNSLCLNETEQKDYNKLVTGKNGAREKMLWFHNHGYGNSGATSGHLIPAHENLLKKGWKGIHAEILKNYNKLSQEEQAGSKGEQLRAMMSSATLPRELSLRYAELCSKEAAKEKNKIRKSELLQMSENLGHCLWEAPKTFWEAVQSLWISHMLIMSDENYPGPGVSFGRMDQYLLPYYEYSISQGMDKEFAKEILKCFWFHANTAYDATIRNGNQGITAGYGQLITISGMGKDGRDLTNELSYLMLEVIDEMSPILEPKPNVRLHKNSPDKLLDIIVDMINSSQGAPFLLNFDERSMAGMMHESTKTKLANLINEDNVHEYCPVGCLENTMVGNDRSGTVDNNINLLKAVELALTSGKDLLPFSDPVSGKTERIKQDGPKTKKATSLKNFDEFWNVYKEQTKYIIKKITQTYENSESVRAKYFPTPYLSCLVKGCADKALDITKGGAEISFTTIEGVTYATTVDSLLAIKHLVYENKDCTMDELITALKDNWVGHEVLQARAKYKAPKFGQDNDEADKLAKKVMELWANETWKYKTKSTNRQFRPGMLSWNYWAGDGFVMAASADGRAKGTFLSNAICPSNGADTNGPTSNTNSVGKVLGGKSANNGDWKDYNNNLPNGASHTITFNPSLLKNPEHKNKFKAFLKGYVQNGGTALQVNILDKDVLIDAQKNPQDYRHLLVRITGYNAYFTSVGKELQNEVIARLSHERY